MAHKDPLALLLHVGDAFATLFRQAPGFAVRRTAESWFASAGEAHCLWNWVGLTSASPESIATLQASVAQLRERRLEGLVCYPPDAADSLGDTVEALGLGEAGSVPLMVCDAADVPPSVRSDVRVERLTSVRSATIAASAVISASFDIPPDQTPRVINAALLQDPGVAVYAASRGGVVGGALTSTRFDDAVSIDIMSVDPAAQRQGIGRALILAAMRDQITTGATSFHLLSSSEGKRLYDQVGFTTLLETYVRFIPLDPIPADQVVT